MEKKTNVYFMVGIPGSGKSTYVANLKKDYEKEGKPLDVHSSDDMRDEGIEESVLFDTLHKRIEDSIDAGHDCVYDATNLNRKRRIHAVRLFRKHKCNVICVCMLTPFGICKEQNKKRKEERIVPEHVLERMVRNFDIPMKEEGFKSVIFIKRETDGKFFDSISEMNEISHDNPHHSNTIGNHMLEAEKYIRDNYSDDKDYVSIMTAARYHDCGKPFTKTFVNTKGETTETAHYYGHDGASAYLFITEIAPMLFGIDTLYVTELINWHMRPFLAWKKSENAFWRDKKLLGDRKLNALLKVHEADVNAH